MSRASPEATPPAPASEQQDHVFYPVKWILDKAGNSLPICMQGQNGPCALLALVNVNLQRRVFALEAGTTRIREDHLMAILADYVSTRPSPPPGFEQAVADFIDLLPRLNRGMHVNVRFTGPTAFEFTRELSVFDIFPGVRLLHGWLVDPQDLRLADALGSLSYNQVIDELVRTANTPPAPPPEPDPVEQSAGDLDALVHVPSAPPPEAFDPVLPEPGAANPPSYSYDAQAPVPHPNLNPNPNPVSSSLDNLPEETPHTIVIREIRPFVMDFLESNPTQLTVYGLTELHSTMHDDETSILFRNSHFYVINKHAGELFTLVTDVGYLNELNTVWEKLSDVNGDSTFYNGSFQRISDSGTVTGASPAGPAPPQPFPSTSAQAGRAAQNCGAPESRTSAFVRPSAVPPPRPVSTATGAPASRRKSTEKCVIQ